jgi:hypothetical protein
MARWQCAACGATVDDLLGLCTGCRELRPAEAGWPAGPTLILLYPAEEQRLAAALYRAHVALLGAAGYLPVATSWGETPPGVVDSVFFAHVEESFRVGTLLVTYRREPAP